MFRVFWKKVFFIDIIMFSKNMVLMEKYVLAKTFSENVFVFLQPLVSLNYIVFTKEMSVIYPYGDEQLTTILPREDISNELKERKELISFNSIVWVYSKIV